MKAIQPIQSSPATLREASHAAAQAGNIKLAWSMERMAQDAEQQERRANIVWLVASVLSIIALGVVTELARGWRW